jgi:hypothetical protein
MTKIEGRESPKLAFIGNGDRGVLYSVPWGRTNVGRIRLGRLLLNDSCDEDSSGRRLLVDKGSLIMEEKLEGCSLLKLLTGVGYFHRACRGKTRSQNKVACDELTVQGA